MHPSLEHPCLWIVLTMLGIAAITDLRSGLIPNSLVLSGAVAGVLAQLLTSIAGGSMSSLLAQMSLGLLACSIVPGVLYALGSLGGGDLKLFAATGLCLGPVLGLEIQLGAHLLAAACLPLYFLRRGGLLRMLRGVWTLLSNPFVSAERKRPIDRAHLTSMRFAPAIFGAAVWVAWFGGVTP
jgi:prepilin peptidase CpaA